MWSQWYLLNDKSRPNGIVIKRYSKKNGRTLWQNYPAREYTSLQRTELELFLKRINVTHELERKAAEARYDFDHAFINKHSKERYEEYLGSRADDQNHIRTLINYLESYTLEFFVILKKVPDPEFWQKYEHDWGLWLANDKKLSASTIKQIAQNANRFLKFISTRLYPKMQCGYLEPLGKTKLKKLKARQPSAQRYKYVSEELFEKILKENKESSLLPAIKLAYLFGLRLSEVYGLSDKKFFGDSVLISQQGIGCTDGKMRLGLTKTSDTRKVPYWYISPQNAFKLVKVVEPMHPDTLNKKVNDLLGKYGRQSHDLRRSFITRSLRKQNHRDVQLAAGHKDLRTTLVYAQDDRELSTKQLSLDELEG